jgi:hypothetical protein
VHGVLAQPARSAIESRAQDAPRKVERWSILAI